MVFMMQKLKPGLLVRKVLEMKDLTVYLMSTKMHPNKFKKYRK